MSKLESLLNDLGITGISDAMGIKPTPNLAPLTREEAAVVRDALLPLARLVVSKTTLGDLIEADLTAEERAELRYYTAALAISKVMKGMMNLFREVAAPGAGFLKEKMFEKPIKNPGTVQKIVFRVPDDSKEPDLQEELIIEAMFGGLRQAVIELTGVKEFEGPFEEPKPCSVCGKVHG